ncbi:hypothetical protein Hanom_Chr10g00963461 [Helianthus anomalus]
MNWWCILAPRGVSNFKIECNPCFLVKIDVITRPQLKKSSFSRSENAGGVADGHLGRPRRPLEVSISPDALICCLRRFLADGTNQRASPTVLLGVTYGASKYHFLFSS